MVDYVVSFFAGGDSAGKEEQPWRNEDEVM
jgi:hypothetical protein